MTTTTPTVRLGRASLRNSVWYVGQLITFLAIGEDTEGMFALLRVHGIQDADQAAHRHAHEDETIYVVSGELSVSAGGEELHAHPGESVTIPLGVEHTVNCHTAEALFLLQYSPAGFERYFHEMSEPAEYLGLPSHPVPLDHARMVVTAARYGCLVSDTPSVLPRQVTSPVDGDAHLSHIPWPE